MYFGEKLKRLRQEHNWTQPDLAEKLGIEQSWLSKIENDKSLPSSELLDKIAESFNLTLQELVEDLDPDYVANSLASLPEVRGMLQQRKFKVVHRARNLLVSATLCLAVGISLTISGQAEFFFSDSLYIYESEGLVLDSEPEDLFIDRDDIIESLIWSDMGPDAEFDSTEFQQQFQSKLLELSRREDLRKILSSTYRGNTITVSDNIDQGTTDIFGNSVAAGSEASRLYYQTSIQQQRNTANSVLAVLGIFLIVVSIGLFATEVRLSRLVK